MWTRLKSRLRPVMPLWHALRRLLAHDGIEIAGYTAYTVLVSLFPFVIFLCSLAGFLGDAETAQKVISAAFKTLPREVASTLTPIVKEIFKQDQPGLMTVGIFGTLWVTSSGVETLRMGTIRGWEIEETRPIWRRRLTSLLYVAFAGVAVLGASLLVIVAPVVIAKLEHLLFIEDTAFLIVTALLRLVLAFTLIAAMVAVLYRYLPPVTIPWRLVWPGALLVAGSWILLASLFSFYLSQSGDYTVTYGSLGGVVITLLFMHFSAILFLLGVEFNASLVKPAGTRVLDLINAAKKKREKIASPERGA